MSAVVRDSARSGFQFEGSPQRLCTAGAAPRPIYNAHPGNHLAYSSRKLVGILPFSAPVTTTRAPRNQPLPTWKPPRDYRVICSCQRHRVSRFFGEIRMDRALHLAAEQMKKRAGALLIAVPLAFGALYPIDAMNLADGLMNRSTEVATASRLGLITPRVAASFLTDDNRRPAFTLEAAKEQFFRSEIPWGSVIYHEAKDNGLPPELVAAVIEAESDFRPTLVSRKDAQGLMQVVPETGRLMGVDDLMNPRENIRAGSRYLRYLVDRYKGNQRMALAAYNAGEGNVARFGGVPPFRETMDYIRRVATRRMLYQRRVDHHFVASLRMRMAVAVER
jgi:soluble lytic murein transglycosylase-like protein